MRGATVAKRSITATKTLVARWVGSVSTASRVICPCSSSSDRSSTYRRSTIYATAIYASAINATVIDATVINASAMNAAVINAGATTICESVS